MKKVFVLVILFLPFIVFSETLTLKEAINKALTNNPRIKALRLNLKANEYGVKASKSLKFGELDFKAGVKKTSDAQIIRPMSRELILSGLSNLPFDDQYWYWGLNYSLPIYMGGKIKASERIAEEKKSSVYYSLKRYTWDLRYRVSRVFLNLISVDKQIESLNNYLKALKSFKSHVEDGFKSGKFAEVDVLKVNFQIEDAKYKIESLKQVRESLMVNLANLLGEREMVDYSLKMPEKIDVEFDLPSQNILIKKAYSNRSDFKIARTISRIKHLNYRIKKSDWLPHLSLNASLLSVNGDNIEFNDKFWSVSANISIPIFDMGRRYHTIKMAKKEELSANENVNSIKLTIRDDVVTAYSKCKKEFQNYKTAIASLKLQKEVERIEQLKYDNGRGDIDDLLMARAKKQLAEANVIKAKFNFFIAKEELKKSIEGDLK